MSKSGMPSASARPRVCRDTTAALARVRAQIFWTNSTVELTSSGTRTAPMRRSASIAIPYSGRFTPSVMTRSPLRTPESTKDRATRGTTSARSRYVQVSVRKPGLIMNASLGPNLRADVSRTSLSVSTLPPQLASARSAFRESSRYGG